MRVAVDGRSLAGAQSARGVAVYLRGVLRALAHGFPDDEWRVVVPAGGLAAAERDLAGAGLEFVSHAWPPRLAHAAGALTGRPRLDRMAGTVDVAWVPAPAPVAVSAATPYVLTLHDLSFEHRPRDYTPYERLWHHVARPARLAARARGVAPVSAATARAAIDRWGLDTGRVQVVSPGVDLPDTDAPAPPGLPERFLLFVGALEPRKAPDLLMRSFARARDAGLDADLVVVGEGRLAAAVAGPGVHRLSALDPRSLGPLYSRALALVMPSWEEGFGFPVLEALAAGTPAVVSDLPVFAETVGEGALRVPAGDEAALAGAMTQIAGDPDLRRRLVAAGEPALARYSWTGAAQAMRALLAGAAA